MCPLSDARGVCLVSARRSTSRAFKGVVSWAADGQWLHSSCQVINCCYHRVCGVALLWPGNRQYSALAFFNIPLCRSHARSLNDVIYTSIGGWQCDNGCGHIWTSTRKSWALPLWIWQDVLTVPLRHPHFPLTGFFLAHSHKSTMMLHSSAGCSHALLRSLKGSLVLYATCSLYLSAYPRLPCLARHKWILLHMCTGDQGHLYVPFHRVWLLYWPFFHIFGEGA